MNKNVATLGIALIITLKALFWWGDLIPWQLSFGVGFMFMIYGSYLVIKDITVQKSLLYVISAWFILITPIIYTIITYEKPDIIAELEPEVSLNSGVLKFNKEPISIDKKISKKYQALLTKNELKLVFPKPDSVKIDSVHFYINDKQYRADDILETCSINKDFSFGQCSSSPKFTELTQVFDHGNEYRVGWKLIEEINLEDIIIVTIQEYISDTSNFVMLDFENYMK